MDKISESTGLNVKYIIFDSWEEMNNALLSEEIDLICNQGITEERKELFDFTIPVHVFPVSIFILNDNTTFNSVDDLEYARVAVVATNVGVTLLREKDNINTIIYDTPLEALFGLLAKEVDALVYPEPIIQNFLIRLEMENKVKIASEPLLIIKRAMAVKKGNQELINILNTEILNFVNTPDFQVINHKWFGEPESFWSSSIIFILVGSGLFILLIILFISRFISIHRLNKELNITLKEKHEVERKVIDLSLFPDQNPNPVLRVSKAGKIIYCNNSCNQILTKDQVESKHMVNKLWQEAIIEALKTSQIQQIEIEYNKKVFVLFFNPFQENDYVNIYGLDITERKLAETSLKESQERWRIALEGTDQGIWEWYIKTGKVIYNDSWMRLLGYEPGEIDVNYEWWANNVDPENIPILEKAVNDYLEGKRTYLELEYRIKTKQGLWKWCWARGVCIDYDEAGKPIRLIGTSRDFTEYKEAQQARLRSEKNYKDLAASLLLKLEEERTNISRELHDELGQDLSIFKISLTNIKNEISEENQDKEKFEALEELIDQIIIKMRNIASGLRPALLDSFGLIPAIENYAENFKEKTGIEIITNDIPEEFQANNNIITAIFRIIQESLTNVVRHSKATKVKLSINIKDGQIELKLQDNGIGIKKEKLSNFKSLGILGMKERAEQLHGNVEITSEKNKGTTVHLTLPLNKENV